MADGAAGGDPGVDIEPLRVEQRAVHVEENRFYSMGENHKFASSPPEPRRVEADSRNAAMTNRSRARVRRALSFSRRQEKERLGRENDQLR
ncbi:hypothetical protein MSC49_34410 [Methylosinus sp. C49]|nr:hypothetical protein MSC49_34410 [Methylosinus sp. C49]